MMITPLLPFRRNVHSQNCEDGVLEVVFGCFGLQPTWVCEVGAWDGKHLSNSFLWVERGARAVYIEGDRQKYESLSMTAASFPDRRITAVCAVVTPEGETRLDRLLSSTAIPLD